MLVQVKTQKMIKLVKQLDLLDKEELQEVEDFVMDMITDE